MKRSTITLLTGISALLFVSAFIASAQITNPSFEVVNSFQIPEKTVGDSATLWLPASYGDWAGDNSKVVASENGITPIGKRMLKFLNTWVNDGESGPDTQGAASQVRQLVDLSPYAASVASGTIYLELTANFNRVNANSNTDTQFNVAILAFEGDPAAAPTLINGFAQLSKLQRSILTDADPQTWEKLTSRKIHVPINTDFVSTEVHAIENIQNNDDAPGGADIFPGPEFDGHYADLVNLAITP